MTAPKYRSGGLVNRPGRRAFVSGKRRQNTKKATVITDGCHVVDRRHPARRMHDQTALKTAGICDLLERFPQVKARVDAGYQGLARQSPASSVPAAQASQGGPATGDSHLAGPAQGTVLTADLRQHANAERKQWRTLQRCTGRRAFYDHTHLAIAGLVSGRAARR